MTKEEKQLLLKDLSARLPYGVKVCARFNTGNRYTANVTAICEDRDYIQIRQNVLHPYTGSSIEDIRPYLRPMSSMTEKEKENLQLLHDIISDENYGDGYSPSAWDAITEWEDYCNSRHLDYRGLIKNGLALEAPRGMYKIN